MNQFYYVDTVFHLVLLILFSWDFVVSQIYTGSCHTPDHSEGRCVNIQRCRSLLGILQSGRPPSPADINFLTRSQCGFEGKNPLVCCPENNFGSESAVLCPLVTQHHSPSWTPTKGQPHETAPSLVLSEKEEAHNWLPSSFEPTLQLPIQNGATDVSRHPGVAQFLPEHCGFFTEEKITGGNATGLFEFPWMALLGYFTRNGLQYRCGGSLINIRYVLTAAHCIKTSKELQLSRVRLGEYNMNTSIDCQVEAGCAPPVQDFGVEKAIAHPLYNPADIRNDIGLIRLNRNAILTDSVSPVCLPIGKLQQERSLEGETLTVTGWGATENGLYSPVLQKVKVPVMPLSKCAELYSKMVRITKKQICAGGVDIRDSCNGDSGGPLQRVGQTAFGEFSYIQFGIVSFGPITCGLRERPGVYTRVGYYMEWILNNIRY